MTSTPDVPHVVKIRHLKGAKKVVGTCSHPSCPYEISAPDTSRGNRSVHDNATFHQNHHGRYRR